MSNSLNRKIQVGNIIEEGRMGGPQLRMFNLALSLNKKIDMTLILPSQNSKIFKKKCKSLNIKTLSVDLTTLRRNWISILKYVFLFPIEVMKLSLLFKKYKFDIIHVSGGSWQIKGVIAAKLVGKKVVWELNDTYAPKVIRAFFFLISDLADVYIYASYRSKKYYKKLIPSKKKNYVIQSPVDVNLFNPNLTLPIDKFIKKKNFKKKIIVGLVGNINPVKGYLTLVKCVKELSFSRNDIIFLIIGEIFKSQKEYFNLLKEFLKENKIKNVHFVGLRKDTRPLLKAIDIYVCSSYYESSPLSVWEAMAMKKAIISTDVGDIKKFIKNDINGIIINPNDEKALAEAISKLIKNSKLRISFGKLARQVSLKKLDLKKCARLNYNVYKNINH